MNRSRHIIFQIFTVLASICFVLTSHAVESSFEGIVSLEHCSGSLIRYDSSFPGDKALILTNGHCIDMGSYRGIFPEYGEVIKDVREKIRITLLGEEGESIGDVETSRLVYATMTGTDLAIYELNISYAQLSERFGVNALTLSRNGPKVGDRIKMKSGYFSEEFSCRVDKVIEALKEGPWVWENSYRFDPMCKMKGGTSGSPVVNELNEVVAISNTGVENNKKDCSIYNPCEIEFYGDVITIPSASYAQQSHQIYSCLDTNNELDLELNGCLLPK